MAIPVLMVTAAAERGGAEAVMEMIAARLDRARFRPLLATADDGALAAAWRAQGFTVIGTPHVSRLARLDQQLAVVNCLERAIRREGVGLVHTHGVVAQIQGGRAGHRAGVPVLCHSHDQFNAALTVDGMLHRVAVHTRRAHTVVVSQTVADSLHGRVPAAAMTVLPNGVLPEVVPPAQAAPTGLVVVWCGRLQRWKGAHLFLEMARLVHRAQPHARFVIVGDAMFGMEPEYPGELRRLASDLGVESVVTFVGQVADARPWLAAADVVVHSSTRPDPFPLVVLEAMMQGRALVAFARGGPAEAVDESIGRLVAPDDVSALAEAVSGLLGDGPLRETLGKAARIRALERFSVDAMVRRIQEIYVAVDNRRVRT